MIWGTLSTRNARFAAGFLLVFALYQAAEGLGARVFHAPALQAGLMLAALLAAWPASVWLGYRGYGAYGLDLSWRSAVLVVAGLAVAAVARGGALAAGLALGWYHAGPRYGIEGEALAAAVASVALATFVPSLAEDILTRGFWLRAANIAWSGTGFVLVSSLIYLVNHLYHLDQGPIEWLRLLCFGLAYACAAWRFGTLWAAVALHWGWNLSNGLLGLIVPLQSTNPVATSLLSSAAHIVILGLLLLLPSAVCAQKMQAFVQLRRQ